MHTNPLQNVLGHVEAVRSDFVRILDSVGIRNPRVRELTEQLGIEKSTASRLARGLRAADAAEVLREFPSAEGLTSVACATAGRGAPADAVERTTASIARLERALKEFPGGRAGALSAIAKSQTTSSRSAEPEPTQQRAERAARRAIYSAGSYLQGITVEAAVHGLFLGPGSSPGRLHQAMLNAVIGVRRMRPGPPITVAGVYGSPLNQVIPTRVALNGEPIREDPGVALLPEFCRGDMNRLTFDRSGSAHLICWGTEDPPLDQPATVVHGVNSLDFFERVKSDRFHYACVNYTVRRPTKLLVIEVMVSHEAFVGKAPMLHFSMDQMRIPDPIAGPPPDGREMLEQAERFNPMGRGFARPGTSRADTYVPLFASAFQRLGWNPDDFNRFRLEIEYPIPFIGIQTWFELDDR